MSTLQGMALETPGWTASRIAERLAEAADVLDRLPAAKLPGLYSLLPFPPDTSTCDGARVTPAAPSPEAIDRMDEVLGWLLWLEPEERQLVWLRAEGLPWKWITRRLGMGRTTAWQRWSTALLKIAVRLDAAAEQNRPDIKQLNRCSVSVLERR